MFFRFRKIMPPALSAAVALTIMASILGGAAPKPTHQSIRARILSTTDTVPLALADSTTVTNQSLRSWLEIGKPSRLEGKTIEEILSLPATDLADVISELSFYVTARSEALKDADFVTTALPPMLATEHDNLLCARFMEIEMVEKNPPMTEAEARAWYEKNMSLYTRPTTFTARVIFLSTYRPFIIRKSETPGFPGSQIARDEIGDPLAINRILDAETSTPIFNPLHPKAVTDFLAWEKIPREKIPRENWPPVPQSVEMLAFMPQPPPKDNQRVYIPVKEPERKAVRERMEKIAAQLKEGADFEALARQFSDEPAARRGALVGPLPLPGRPILESVLEAAQKTAVGQVTPILDTPHGILIMQILDKSGRTVQPYEEVRAKLIQDEVTGRRRQAWTAIQSGLFKDPVLKVDRAALMKNDAPDSLEIARVGRFSYAWSDYRRETKRRYSAAPTYEGRLLELAEKSQILPPKILLAKAIALGLENDPKVQLRLSALDTILRGRAYLEWYAEKRIPVSDDQLRKLYLDQKDRFREPARYTVRELIHRIEDPEDLKDAKYMEQRMSLLRDVIAKKIKSERTFSREAGANANWPARERDRGAAKEVEENYRGPEFAKALSTLETGKCHGPFLTGDELFLLWVSERSPVRYRPFDKVRAEVVRLYQTRYGVELMLAAEKEIRARHKLEYLFTYSDKDAGGKGTGK